MMSRSKFQLIVNLISATFFFFLIYNFLISIYDDYQTTSLELEGVKSIDTLLEIQVSLIELQDSTLTFQDRPSSTLQEAISLKHHLLTQYINTHSQSQYQNNLKEFLDNYQTNKGLKAFTAIINKTQQEILLLAEKYYLLFDPVPQSYYLMSALILHMPNLLEDAAILRAVGKEALSSNELSEDNLYALKHTKDNFLHALNEIKHIIYNISDNTNLLLHFTQYEQNHIKLDVSLENIISSKSTQTTQEYQHSETENITHLLNIKEALKSELFLNLKKRQDNQYLTLIGTFIIFIFFLLLFILFLYSEKKNQKTLKKENEARKYKEYAIDSLKETLYHEVSLQNACTQALKFFISELHAHTGTLYLFDTTNQKLNLGAAIGIASSSLKHSINLDDGLVGKAFISQEKQELLLPTKTTINLNLCSVNPSKIVALPLIIYDTVVGVIQLAFIEDTVIDNDYIDYLSEIMANSIKKLQDDEKKIKLLNLIDKNVITSSTNKVGRITYVSDTFASISGYTKEELIGQNHNMVRHPDMRTELFTDMWQTISLGKIWRGELKNRTKSGGFYWVDVMITPDFDFYGNITGYTAVRQDITDKKTIEELSITDALTGIYNRRYFEKIFKQKLLSAKRENKNLAFILIDIDHFKLFNDTYGHQAGDDALKKVAQTLNDYLKRPDDYVFRVGGEEFALLFEVDDLIQAEGFANSIRIAIEELNIIHEKNSASKFITISMGMFFYDYTRSNETHNEAYKYADVALYKAKEFGRNRLHLWREN